MQRYIAQYKLILSNLNNPGFFVLIIKTFFKVHIGKEKYLLLPY